MAAVDPRIVETLLEYLQLPTKDVEKSDKLVELRKWFTTQTESKNDEAITAAARTVATAGSSIVALNPDAIAQVVQNSLALYVIPTVAPPAATNGEGAAVEPNTSFTSTKYPRPVLIMIREILRTIGTLDSKKANAVVDALAKAGYAVSQNVSDCMKRVGMRKNAIAAKSFTPFMFGQAPSAVARIQQIVNTYIHNAANDYAAFNNVVAQLTNVWSDAQMHPVAVVEAIISVLETTDISAKMPQSSLDLDIGAILLALVPSESARDAIICTVFTNLKRCDKAVKPNSIITRQLACAVRHKIVTLEQGYALYRELLDVDPVLASSASTKLQAITKEYHAHAKSTKAETILDMDRLTKSGMKDPQRINSARLFEMNAAVLEPTWGNQFVADKTAASFIAPAFAVELIRVRALAQADAFIALCAAHDLDLFTYPRLIADGSVLTAASEVMSKLWSTFSVKTAADSAKTLAVVEAHMPLATRVGSRFTQQALLTSGLHALSCALSACSKMMEQTSTDASLKKLHDGWIHVAAHYLAKVFFPALRCLSGTPVMIHGSLTTLMTLMGHDNCANLLSKIPAPQHPHDVVKQAEAVALLTQGLRRVTKDTIKHYTLQLRQVVYTNPAVVIEKLLGQAVGYSDANLLVVHAQLIRHAPPSVLQLFVYAAVAAMQKFADEEREGAETRVSVLASFVAIVWRQNLSVFSPAFFLEVIEKQLRNDARSTTIFATEALQSIFTELHHQPLEVFEQHNELQLAALCAGPQTRWFARGCAESFYASRWDELFTPHTLSKSRAALRKALVGDGNQIGATIVKHLLRLQATIYERYSDLSGTMEAVLMLTAGHHDRVLALALLVSDIVANDDENGASPRELWHTSNEASSAHITDEILKEVAMPHIAQRLSRPVHVVAEGEDFDAFDPSVLKMEGATTLLEKLHTAFWSLNAFQVFYQEGVYNQAKNEIDRFVRGCTNKSSKNKLDRRSSIFLSGLKRNVEKEQAAHIASQDKSRAFLMKNIVQPLLATGKNLELDVVEFVHNCLLPRALISHEDAIYTVTFLETLLDLAARAATVSPDVDASVLIKRLADCLLTFITEATVTIVTHTPAEVKRVGVAVRSAMQVLKSHIVAPLAQEVVPKSAMSFRNDHLGGVKQPQLLLHVEAYLTQVYVPILTDTKNIPQFVHRNTLQQLQRLQGTFPVSPRCVLMLKDAVEVHNNRRSQLFAMASAICKSYNDHITKLEAAKGKAATLSSEDADQLFNVLLAPLKEIEEQRKEAAGNAEDTNAKDADDEEVDESEDDGSSGDDEEAEQKGDDEKDDALPADTEGVTNEEAILDGDDDDDDDDDGGELVLKSSRLEEDIVIDEDELVGDATAAAAKEEGDE